MATITNIINTLFTVNGSREAQADLVRLNRGVTRLGQSSASAGRSFAAQSQGLGGLVAAYAGAAATSFALQQAFDKLAASARTLQTLQGLTTLAAVSGQSAEALLTSVREITKGQLTIAESAAQINLSLSAGFNTAQIEGLAAVASKASRALGRDLTDAMTRVVRGSSKMETELLDELGIYTKIDPAVRAYAASIGKSVTQLSEFERRQAFANSVIEEGLRKFSAINTTVPNAAEQIEAFGTKMVDLATIVGQFIAEGIAPLAAFLTDNLAAAFGTAGLVAALLASKGIMVLKQGVDSLAASFIKAGLEQENNTRRRFKLTEVTLTANEAVKNLTISVVKLTLSEQKELAALQALSAQRSLSRSEFNQVNKLIDINIQKINERKAAILSETATERTALAASIAARRDAIKKINEINARSIPQPAKDVLLRSANRNLAAANVQYVTAARVIETQRNELRELNRTASSTEKIMGTVGTATQGAAARFAAFTGALSRATAGVVAFGGAVLSNIIGLLTKPFFFISLFSLIGSSVANLIGKGPEFEAFTKQIGDSIKGLITDVKEEELQKAIEGFAAGTLADLEKVGSELAAIEEFTYKSKSFFGVEVTITKTKEDLVREVSSALSDAATAGTDSFVESFDSAWSIILGIIGGGIGLIFGGAGAVAGAAIGSSIGAAIAQGSDKEVDAATNRWIDRYLAANEEFSRGLSENEARTAALAIKNLEENYDAAAKANPAVRAALELQRELVRESAQYVDNMEAVAQVMNALGVDAGEAARKFEFIDSETVEGIGSAVSTAITTISNSPITLRFIDADTDEVQRALDRLTFVGIEVKPEVNKQDLEIALDFIRDRGIATAEEFTNVFASAPLNLQDAFIQQFGALNDITDNTLQTILRGTTDLGGIFIQLDGYTTGATAAVIRSANAYQSVFSAISDGTITLENFNQLTAAGSTALSESAIEIAKVQELITAQINQIAKIREGGVSAAEEESLNNAQGLLREYVQTKNQLEDNVDLLRQIRTELQAQEEVIRKQVNTIEFLNSRIGNQVNPIEQIFTAIRQGLGDTAADTAELDFFGSLIAQSATANDTIAQFTEFLNTNLSDDLKNKLESADISLQSLFQLDESDIGTMTGALKGVKGDLISIEDGFLKIGDAVIDIPSVLDTQQVDVYQKTLEAIKKVIDETIFSLMKTREATAAIITELEKEVALEQQVNDVARLNLELTREQNRIEAENDVAELKIQALEQTIELRQQEFDLIQQAAELEMLVNENKISSIETQANLARTLADIQIAASERQLQIRQQNDTDALESLQRYATKLSEVGNISELEEAITRRDLIVSLDLEGFKAIEQSLNSEVANIEQAFKQFIVASAQIAQQQIQNAQAEYNAKLDILTQQKDATNAEIDSRLAILAIQKDNAQLELVSAIREVTNLRSVNEQKQELLSLERAQAEKQISDELEIISMQENLLIAQSNLDIAKINAERDQQIAKATADNENIIAQYEVLDKRNLLDKTYFENWNKLLAAFGMQEQPFAITDRADIENTLVELRAQTQEISRLYNDLADERVGLVLATTNVELGSLDARRSALAQALVQEQEYSQRLLELQALEASQSVELAKAEVQSRLGALQDIIAQEQAALAERAANEAAYAAGVADINRELANVTASSAQELSKALSAIADEINNKINSFIDSMLQGIGELKSELNNLQAEKITLEIELAMQAADLQQQIDDQLANAQISNIQAQIQLIESQEAGKVLSAVEAAERVNELQLRILDIEEERLIANFRAEQDSLTKQATLVKIRAQQDADNIAAQTELQIANATSQYQYLKGLTNAFKGQLTAQTGIFNNFISSLATTLTRAANEINRGIVSGIFKEIISANVAAAAVNPVELSGLDTNLVAAGTTLQEFSTISREVADRQIELVEMQRDAELRALEEQRRANEVLHGQALDTLDINRQNQEQQRQNALADAADSGSEEQDKINDMLKSLQEKFRDTLQSITDQVSEILGKVFDIISEAIVRVQQANIDQLKLQEDLVSGILSSTESRLSDVQSSLNETLEEEINLREQIKTQTEELVKTQEDLIKSFSLQDSVISDTSALYIEKLLEQKKSMISLGKASDTVLALQKEEKTLLQQQADQQQALESITNSRIAAEEKLATTQDILGIASDVLSGKFMELQNTFMELAQTIQAVMQMVGIAGGVPGTSMIGLNEIGEVVLEFKKGAEEILKAGGNLSDLGADASIQAQAAGEISESLGISANALSITASAAAGAFQGFSVGNVIAGIVGDTGFATSIGGAIGGALGSAASVAITQGLIFAGNAFLAVALPVIGPIIGALIGSLFKKTPKAEVAGTISAEGSEVTRETSTGGAKKETSMSLFGIAEQSINAMISMLESAGIQFTETVAVSIKMSGDKIKDATLQFGDDVQKFTSGALGSGQAGAEAAAEFFAESFVQALQVGDLVTADAQLQLALDRFASISDLTLKTPEKLEETINFVFAFEDSLASLQSTGMSTAYVLDTITKAATENADALAAYYTSFLEQTSEVFGETSTQFAEAEAAVRENALALVGLGEITIDGVTSIVSLSEALGELNTGAIVVSEAIDTILNSTSALEAANIENVSDIQNIAVTNAIDTLLTDISVELSDAIALLEDPANAAIVELENIITQSTDVLTVQQGIFDELTARQAAGVAVTNEQLAQAEQNIALQEQLIDLNLTEYLSSLSLAELEVVSSSELLTEEYKQLVDAQLEAAKAIEEQKAFTILINSTEEFYDSLRAAGAGIDRLDVLGVATDYQSLADSINATEIDPFITELTDLINNISMGTDAVTSYEEALALLNDQYGESLLTTEEAAALLEQLNATSAEYVDALYALYQELESITEDIRQVLMDSISAVETSIEELGNTIVDSLENLISSTNDILGIYDDTLSSVAESGNKLFDLRDNAVKSLNESSKALRDFEKQNNLSGKTSAELTAELARVQANLNAMLADPDIDLAEFMQISALTSQQRYLQNEISGLTEVEAEYTELLSSRDQAIQDLTYAESVILSLGDKLIDTRKTESEIIQEIQEVTTTFVNAQQDLLDITVLLDEANFNLLQARIDEEDAVNKVKKALDLYTNSLDTLQENITGLLEEDLVSTTVQASIDNYALSLEMSGIVGAEAAQKLDDFTASAIVAGEQIASLIESINTFLNPELPDASEIVTPDYGQIVGMSLTKAFTNFNSDLIKYLDTEGLAQFYGPGGKFAAFRDALVTTLAVDGFDVLTISGGPLETFNAYLIGVGTVISDLVGSNINLIDSITGVKTEIGVLVTGLGTTQANTTAGSSALVIFGNALDTATDGTYTFSTAVGTFIVTVNDENGKKAIDILNSDLPEAITTFTSNIIAYDASLAELTVSNNLGDVVGSITSAVSLYNSDIGELIVSTDATAIFGDIATIVNAFDSTLGAIEISTNTQENAGTISNIINIASDLVTDINELSISNTVENNLGNIYNTINIANTEATKIVDLRITNVVGTNLGNIYNTLNIASSETTKIVDLSISNVVGTNLGNIYNTLNASNKQATDITKLSISNVVGSNLGNIYNTLNAANPEATKISGLTISNTVSSNLGNIYTNLFNANTAVNDILKLSAPTTVTSVSKSIFDNLNSANEQLKNITGIAFPPVPNIESIASAFSSLLELFTAATASAVSTFSANIKTLVTTLTAVRSTPGLINSLTTPAQDIAKLTAEWTNLSKALVGYVGSDGTLQGISAAIAGIAQDLADAWDDVVGDLGTPGTINVTATVPNVTVNNSNALSDTDKSNLKNIATNTSRYMPIQGVTYSTTSAAIPNTAIGLASGGLVKGPGTSISDSIPTRLSNGEYVLKAETVKKLGLDALNMLNATGDITSVLASNGRYGDSLVAHINESEAALLKRLGGSGTRNPMTGLLEFFVDPGAVGSVFAKQEAAYLKSITPKLDHGSISANYDRFGSPGSNDPLTMTMSPDGKITVPEKKFIIYGEDKTKIKDSMLDTYKILNESNAARNIPTPSQLAYTYAGITLYKNQLEQNAIKLGNLVAKYPNVGTGPGTTEEGKMPEKAGTFRNRPAQTLAMWANNSIANLPTSIPDPYNKAIDDYVTGMNKRNGNFTDFYMLTNGGLVGDDLSVSTARDRAPALLEPGEFVLRKQAVDALGINNAMRLNATGDAGSDPNIEVNIVNNGTPVNPVDTPTIRKENGKLIVDIVLDDLRNNGPIKRQIKSIR